MGSERSRPPGRSCGDFIAFILAGHPSRSNGAGLWGKVISSGLFRISSVSSNCLFEPGLEGTVKPSSGSLWTSSLDWTGNELLTLPKVGSVHLCCGNPVASAVLGGLSPGTQGVTDIFCRESGEIIGCLLRCFLVGLSRCP